LFPEVVRGADAEVCRFVYAGLHGLAQGLDQILDAVSMLDPSLPVRFDFYGDGPQKDALRERARSAGWHNVRFHDPIPHHEVAAVLSASDVAIVPLAIKIEEAVPSKLYEAMAAATAVLLVSDSEANRMIEEADAGVSVLPGTPDDLAAAIETMAGDPQRRRAMGENGRRFVSARFDRARLNDEVATFLESELH
jgi:glycosyltransferase involved in cell wall biosynthesis